MKPKLSIVAGKQQPPKKPPETEEDIIRVNMDDMRMSDIVPRCKEFVEQLSSLTDTTRIILEVDRDFKCLADIRDFRHIIGAFITTLDIVHKEILKDLRQCWFNLYHFLVTDKVVNLQMNIAYNLYGACYEMVMTVNGDIELMDDENFYDTINEKPLHERFGTALQASQTLGGYGFDELPSLGDPVP